MKDVAKHVQYGGEFVTIKELKALKTDIKTQRAFMTEASHLCSLPYVPGIVRVLDYFIEKNEKYFLVFELCDDDAKSLRHTADQMSLTRADELSVLSPDEITTLMVEMMDVLAALHAHDPPIRHGSICPECIITSPAAIQSSAVSMRYKLGGFGRAIAGLDMNLTAIVGYTQAYVSPELLLIAFAVSTEPLTCASDIWAFGATLVNLVLGFDIRGVQSGRPSNTDRKLRDGSWSFEEGVLAQLTEAQAKLWSQQSKLTQNVMQACLRCNPVIRPSAVTMKDWSSAYYKQVEIATLKAENKMISTDLQAALAREQAALQEIASLKAKIKEVQAKIFFSP